MIVAKPTRWFSRAYRLADDEREVGVLRPALLTERAAVELEGEAYTIRRDGLLGPFLMERDGETVAAAEKPSAFRSRFRVAVGGRISELDRRGAFGRSFDLLENDEVVGVITRPSIFSRRIEVVLPEEWPLPERVFLLWLALMVWKREEQGAAGG